MKTIILLLIINFILSAQPFGNFLSEVNSISDSLSKKTKVDSFMNVNSIPYIFQNEATFLYRGAANSVSVAGDFNGWQPNYSMLKIPQTNLFYYTKTFELNARLDYKFVLNSNQWILDPFNPNTCNGGFGPNSELAMPEYIQPWEIKYYNGIQYGTVNTITLASTKTGSTYQIKIYLPPGYDVNNNIKYPAVYFQDGYEYIDLAYAKNVLDNLIDSGKIAPVIGVFVRPTNRNEEYAYSKRNSYRLFFVNELVPHIDANYKTINEASKRLVIGDSFGGNISALIAINHPEIFGNAGLHSAAFWPNNYETYNFIISQPKLNIKWVSVWGTYESLFTNMRNFRDEMISKEYEFYWSELPEGHSWGLWRANIDFIIEKIFPNEPTFIISIENPVIDNYILGQNYPNPFNPNTTIIFSIPNVMLSLPVGRQAFRKHDIFVSLKVFDILGNEVATLVNEELAAGNYKVEWNAENLSSGIYYYKLVAGNFTETKKMIFLK